MCWWMCEYVVACSLMPFVLFLKQGFSALIWLVIVTSEKKKKKFEKFKIFNIFRKLCLICLDPFHLGQDVIIYPPIRLEYIHDICTACFMLQRISPTFFELFLRFGRNCDFFIFDILEEITWKVGYPKRLYCYLISRQRGISFLEWVHWSS